MKVTILGYQPVEYTSKKTGELKTGLSVYYAAENTNTIGLMTNDVWIDKTREPELYEQVRKLDVSKPLHANFGFEVEIGSRYPRLVSINV